MLSNVDLHSDRYKRYSVYCGGAFIDIEKTISERRHDSFIGFGAPVRANMRTGGVTTAAVTSSLLETVESSDLIPYGLIPEFVGRFPILVNLLALTENQLIQVLTEPKNALGKQYKKLFQMNGIPDERVGDDIIDVVVDEEAVGVEEPGCGAKILYGKGALERYLSSNDVKDIEAVLSEETLVARNAIKIKQKSLWRLKN